MIKFLKKYKYIVKQIITGFGILLILLNNLGYFKDNEKSKFAELVLSSVKAIPRNTPGFEEFLKDFPPPDSIPSSSIIQISDKHYYVNRDPNVINTVSYDTDSLRTEPIARFDEVGNWAENHLYGWLGFLIVLLAFFFDLFSFSMLKRKKNKHI